MTVRLAPGGPVNGLRERAYLYRGRPFLAEANKGIRERRKKDGSEPTHIKPFSWDSAYHPHNSRAKDGQ